MIDSSLERVLTSRASAHELFIILDALPVPLSWASQPGGEIQFVNQAFIEVFGYTVADLRTVEHFIQCLYPNPIHQTRAHQQWQRLWAERGTGVEHIPEVEVEMACADGRVRTCLHRGILLHDIGVSVATFTDITDIKHAQQMVWRHANEDFLTGLANRRQLAACWHEALQSHGGEPGFSMTYLMLDLDHFKHINDRYGHEAGDDVLRAVAGRLRSAVRNEDVVCRFGGDEFAVLLPRPCSREQVEDLAERLLSALARPVSIPAGVVQTGSSIGIARYPEHGEGLDAVCVAADRALYHCKQTRRGTWGWAQS